MGTAGWSCVALWRLTLRHAMHLLKPCRPPPARPPAPPTRLLLGRQQLAHGAGEVEAQPVLELDQLLQLVLGLRCGIERGLKLKG